MLFFGDLIWTQVWFMLPLQTPAEQHTDLTIYSTTLEFWVRFILKVHFRLTLLNLKLCRLTLIGVLVDC